MYVWYLLAFIEDNAMQWVKREKETVEPLSELIKTVSSLLLLCSRYICILDCYWDGNEISNTTGAATCEAGSACFN